MKLKEIEIVSYRSVTNQIIPVNDSCIGLVGLNESGKTNILRAIRLLDGSFSSTIKDKSKINDTLPKVRYTFDISTEKNAAAAQFCKTALLESEIMPYSSLASKLSVKRYNAFRQLEKEKDEYKKVKRYSCEFSLVIDDQYLKPKDQSVIPAEITVKIEDRDFSLSKVQLIRKTDIPESTTQFFEPVTEDAVKKFFASSLYQFFERNIPQVVFWQYDPQYLLPSEITYANFTKNEDPYGNCAPLYNVFLLSSRLKINDEIDLISKIAEWENDSSLRRRDANIVTDDLNQYIKRIWPDFDQNIRIELEETKITVHIYDPQSQVGNFYEMESRSQGFKTFISFMLTIAAEIDTEQISNCLLLLDEPETHLHPSGARFMRDELLKLSQDNYVVFATHSIFMIDRTNIRRHLIVRKESEHTRISHVDRNNFIQESVIYEALGTTVDEFSIRNKNIIFEGKMDLILFDYLINNCMSKRGNTLLEYELHDAGGTKNIVSFFKNKAIPRESEWIVVLDNDVPGRKVPVDLKKVCLDDSNISCHFYSSDEGKELEDVLPELYIKDAISKTESILNYSPKVGFVIDSKKTVSKNIDEYKYRNSLENILELEPTIKDSLITLIKEKLDGIKETTINKRLEAFRTLFPDYFSVVRGIIEAKGVKIGE